MSKWFCPVVILTFVVVLLAGCETSPPREYGGYVSDGVEYNSFGIRVDREDESYQSTSWKVRARETRLGENVWSIVAGGNAFASASAVRNEAYFWAAQIALDHGYEYIVIVQEGSASVFGTIDRPDTETTTGSVSRIGDTYYGSSTTTTENNDIDYVKYRITMTIECFVDPAETDETVLTASYIVDSLR